MHEEQDLDLRELTELGAILDDKPASLHGQNIGIFLAEALLKVRDRSGRTCPLVANAAQLAFEERRGQQNIVLKARQMGISTWVSGRFFLKTITKPGTLTVMVAHTQEAAEGIFRTVQRFWENLPEALREGVARTSRANARQMIFPMLDSEFRVESAADANAGRGLTIQNLHCSELSRWPGNAAETLAGLKAALSPDGELVMESTPHGAQGCFYEEWQAAERCGVVKHFFPWWMERAYASAAVPEELLTDAERDLMQQHGLSLGQIGYRRMLQTQFRGLAAQEYAEDAESCFLTSGACVFDVDAIAGRMRELWEPVSQRMQGQLLVWYPPVAGREYLVAVDPAGGTSDGDFSTAQVIEMQTGLQCAELQGRLGTLELAKEAAALGKEYNGALVAVERNNHGHGVLAYLDGVARYPRIYAQGGLMGWLTSAASKPMMVSRLGALLVEQARLFLSRRLLMECRAFVRHTDGKMGAAAGTHDDCVMAMALAHAVRAELLESGRKM
ncbi:MAG: phage terminase large subunit family protein [Acidobacteriaceae bacterium]